MNAIPMPAVAPAEADPFAHAPIALELCALTRRFKLKRGLFKAPGEILAVNDAVSYTHLTLPTTPYV